MKKILTIGILGIFLSACNSDVLSYKNDVITVRSIEFDPWKEGNYRIMINCNAGILMFRTDSNNLKAGDTLILTKK